MAVELNHYLELMADRSASDLFLSADAPPGIKIEGVTLHLGEKPVSAQEVQALAYSVMSERQQKEFEATMEMNLAIALGDVGRFRINIYRQRGIVAIAIRYITSHIPSLDALDLPRAAQGPDHDPARAGAGGRQHRLGQVDHAGVDDRLPQRASHRAHPHGRGADRVPALGTSSRSWTSARSGSTPSPTPTRSRTPCARPRT